MKYKLQDLIDIEQFQTLQDRLNEIYSFPSAIIDNDGNILTATAWQDVCTKFHRANKECEKDCIKSDQYILSHLHEANPAVSYRCPHGLVDNATPIIIDGDHYGNFFTGQFFLEKPDLEFFKKQAKKYEFDEEAYLDAVKKTPIWSKEQLDSYLFFIKGLIEVISSSGLKQLKEIEARQKIEETEERASAIISHMLDGFWIIRGNKGQVIDVNHAMCEMLGYTRDELLTMTVADIEAIDDAPEDIEQRIKQTVRDGLTRFQSRHRRKDGKVIDVEISVTYLPSSNLFFAIHRDITDRLQAEKALQASEVRYRELVQNANSAIIRWASDGTVLFLNEYAQNLFGYRSEQIVGKPVNILVPETESTGSDLTELVNNIVAHPEQFTNVVNENICRDGRRVWMAWTNKPVFDENGKPQEILAVGNDITERKRVEDALRESESILSTAEDVAKVGSWKWDLRTQKVTWSEGMFRLFGVETEGFDGDVTRVVNERIHPDDAEAVQESNRSTLEDGNPIPISYRILLPDGSQRTVWAQGKYLQDEMGAPVALTGYVQDITERVQAEAALKESEERLRLFIEHAPASLAMFDREMRYLAVSRRWMLDYGLGEYEILGLSHYDVFPEITDRWKKIHQRGMSGETVRDDEDEFVRLNGSSQWLCWEVRPWNTANGEVGGIVIFSEDITDRKLAEKQIQQQLRRLQALNEIDRAINSGMDIRVSLETLLNKVLVQLDIDAVSILLWNETRRVLEYFAGKGFYTNAIKKSQVKIGVGLAGQAGLKYKVIHVTDLEAAGTEFARAELLRNERFVEYHGVPLIAKGKLKGVLEIFNRSKLNADSEWNDYLETLGGQAAIAIDSAQLFEGMQRSNLELIAAYDATIVGWSHAMDLRDEETEGHSRRVVDITMQLAEKMEIDSQALIHIRRGVLLHDVGKIGVPDHILLKPGKLTDEEWEIMRQHPTYARDMLVSIDYLKPALDIPYCHHEKWDGSGYPRGLKGEEIPLAARLFAIVDVWDALRSDRPYRSAWSKEKTLEYIRNESGSHFDPDVVEAFLALITNS